MGNLMGSWELSWQKIPGGNHKGVIVIAKVKNGNHRGENLSEKPERKRFQGGAQGETEGGKPRGGKRQGGTRGEPERRTQSNVARRRLRPPQGDPKATGVARMLVPPQPAEVGGAAAEASAAGSRQLVRALLHKPMVHAVTRQHNARLAQTELRAQGPRLKAAGRARGVAQAQGL